MNKKENALSTEPYKGVRDFYPEDMAVQNYIFGVWRKIVEQFNFQEYTASLLEPAELYRQKSGDELVNDQMYVFKDKGDRDVALRPEMTPSLARMVAGRRKSLKFPLRWYSVPNCFRYERPQRGRKREHWQLNCDLLGISGIEAEVEIISLAHKIMKEFGAKDEDFEIRINDRKAMRERLEKQLKNVELIPEAIRLLDKKEKISKEEFDAAWSKLSQRPFEEYLSIDDFSNKQMGNLNAIIEKLNNENNIWNIVVSPTLSRGFDYYTGMVFEVFDTNPENRRSLFGGGRYDNLLEMFGVDPVPTVGFGMGDVTMRDFLETHDLPLSVKK